jgi:uncharacterized SAM-binding protein YcdF (DUF218 family)
MDALESYKPILAALALPPVPLLVLVLIGMRTMTNRRALGFFVILMSITLFWLTACSGFALWLQDFVLRAPPALRQEVVAQWKPDARAKPAPTAAATPRAIVVLGGGRERRATEYGVSSLSFESLERLRYGLWLSRETGLPVLFSGGVGWAEDGDPPEAEVAARIAREEFGRPLRWTETRSRDTRDNANLSVPMLQEAGVQELLLVTHAYHMPRAAREFEAAAAGKLRVVAAPMGRFTRADRPLLDWLPSARGFRQTHLLLRELLGLGFQRVVKP